MNDSIFNYSMESLSHWHPDRSGRWKDGQIGLGHHMLITTPESVNEYLPYYDNTTKCCITADARIDYREELARQLEITRVQLKNTTDSQLILHAYQKWGNDCVKHLYGDFAFAIWDQKVQSLFCARDHFGCKPFFYFDSPTMFAFSSEIQGLFSIPEFPRKINEKHVVDSIMNLIPNKGETAYHNLYRLKPAHSLMIEPGSSLRLEKYWDLKRRTNVLKDERSVIDDFSRLLFDAVRQRMRSNGKIGIELSGGLDSSSIAGLASKINSAGVSLVALSHSLSDYQKSNYYPFKDESEYSTMVAGHLGIKNHYLIDGEEEGGSFQALIDQLELTLSPISKIYPMMTEPLLKRASLENINVMLSGFGGDEGVSSTPPGYFDELAIDLEYGFLKKQLIEKSKNDGLNQTRTLLLYYLKYRFRLTRKIVDRLFSKPDFRIDRYKVFTINNVIKRDFNTRYRYFKEIDQSGHYNLYERIYSRLMTNHLVDRIEGTNVLAHRRRIEYRYPLLDVKLIEFYLALDYKKYMFNEGYNRYIFRKAIEGIIPNEICWRRDKSGTTIPNAYFQFLKDEKHFQSIIEESSRSNVKHYVDYKKMHWIIKKIKSQNRGEKIKFGPKPFLSALSILLLQKWQREGKIDIGIKC
ncbi:MAG: asparagine synthase-related protein [Bacteroidota bacterium]